MLIPVVLAILTRNKRPNVDSETVCLRLLIIAMIVLLRLWVVSIELYFQAHFFLQEPVNFIVKLQKRDLNNNQKFFSNAFTMRN